MAQSNNDKLHTIRSIRHLTSSTFVIQFERNELQFEPGQHLSIGTEREAVTREYSIYSGIDDPYLEILIREVSDGSVSKKLKQCNVGDKLQVHGPFGDFKLNRQPETTVLMVATGTGISPYHSFIRSFPDLNYQLIHGVRLSKEAYEKESYHPEHYTLCTSGDSKGDFQGRVTDYFKTKTINVNTQVLLCGNTDMIFEMFEILIEKGVQPEQIQTELYF